MDKKSVSLNRNNQTMKEVMYNFRLLLATIFFLISIGTIAAQQKTITFETDKGTWMALDVSPDGNTINFELLGDIYNLPIQGGIAKQLIEGNAFQSQPRFSPDGKNIVFISDESGADNVWIADLDGKNARQITEFNQELLLSPEWSRDGKAILATVITDGFQRTANLYRFDISTNQKTFS
jgi:Tol biopolymer transport system component